LIAFWSLPTRLLYWIDAGPSEFRERCRSESAAASCLGRLVVGTVGILAFAGVYHVTARIPESVAACLAALCSRLPGEIIFSRHPVPHCGEVLGSFGLRRPASLRIAAPGQIACRPRQLPAIALEPGVVWPRLMLTRNFGSSSACTPVELHQAASSLIVSVRRVKHLAQRPQ